ncbi:hypothetical protein HRbin36_00633 [bacterium HR36]|nr:hypothetical protein HRbin36_00633 [bacterium HR36]
MRDQAYAEAAGRRDGRLADPYQDEQYATQEANAYAAYYSALEQAGAAWAAAERAAYDAWQAAMTAAETAYTSAGSQAWNRYLERLDELNSQLEHTRQILEGAFITAWNNALRDWTEMESEARRSYQSARAQMLQQPPEGPRQAGPPPLEVANLLVMQLSAKPRRDQKPDEKLWDPDSKKLLDDWQKVFAQRAAIDLSLLRKLLHGDRQTWREWRRRQVERPGNWVRTAALSLIASRGRAEIRAFYRRDENGKLIITNVVASTVGLPGINFELPGRWFGRGLLPSRFKATLEVKIEGLKIDHDGTNPLATGTLRYRVTIEGLSVAPAEATQGFEIVGRELKLGQVNYGD